MNSQACNQAFYLSNQIEKKKVSQIHMIVQVQQTLTQVESGML